MSLEDTLSKLKEAFTGKSAEAEAAVKELAQAKELALAEQAKAAEAVAFAEATKATLEKNAAKIAELEAALAEMSKQKVALEASFETAAKQAAKIAASVGVDPVEVSPAVTAQAAKTGEEIALEWATLKQTDPKAAQAFYDRNKSALLAAAGLR
jgi:hypothetical protein